MAVPRRLLSILFLIFLFSCAPNERPVLFPVQGTDQTLFGLSREAAEGKMNVSGQKKLEYRFAATHFFSHPVSLEIEYSLTGDIRPVLGVGTQGWFLPKEGDFGENAPGRLFHYAVPVGNSFPENFNIAPGSSSDAHNNAGYNQLQIHSIKFIGRWYGFYHQKDSGTIYATPFVSGRQGDPWIIEPTAVPADFFPVLSAALLPGKGTDIDADGLRFEVSPHLDRLSIPAGIIAPNVKRLTVSGEDTSFHLGYALLPDFPVPIEADPGIVLSWPLERWRDRRYEVFRWDRFPSLLIFDTADYAVQDRLFKRLAFFVEKAGFRGRMAHDEDIAELHGWNAHDYRAEDLARFFQAARELNFPLLAEERELERILLLTGIIRESNSGIQAGEGGIISVSRESADYLRSRFMAHEGFHGLFFIDEDFRTFSHERWQQLPAEAKRFLVSFFNFQQYDTADEYLLVNEFMAHILQQPISQAGYYFGQSLPTRLESTWRQAHLPAKDEASESWPILARAFAREAEAFSAYVNARWGLAAGRVHLVTVRQP
jgi:hypothetical protein